MVVLAEGNPGMARFIGLATFWFSLWFAAASVVTVFFMWRKKTNRTSFGTISYTVHDDDDDDDDRDRPSVMPSQHGR